MLRLRVTQDRYILLSLKELYVWGRRSPDTRGGVDSPFSLDVLLGEAHVGDT
jgi:hypothetical protein